MNKVRYVIAATSILAVLCLIFVSAPAAQQTQTGKDQVTFSTNQPTRTLDKNPAAAPTPRMSNGHPSLTGFWPGGAQGTDDPGSTRRFGQTISRPAQRTS